MLDVTQRPQDFRRWNASVVVGVAAVVLATLAAAYWAGLPLPSRPVADSGYIVAHGLQDEPLGWLATVVSSPNETEFSGTHTYTLAGVHWRDPQNVWHHWNDPGDPTPVCLIPGEPVAATVGYVQVAVTDASPGYRQAVPPLRFG